MKHRNGPEPPVGSWVIASISDCPDRYHFKHSAAYLDTKDRRWMDEHGCMRTWDELVDPIDALPPEERDD